MKRAGQALIVFSPSGRRGLFPVGTTVLQAARELGVDIDSICGGRARCGRCQVMPVEGRFPAEGIDSATDHLSEMSETERYCSAAGLLDPMHRLSCQAKMLGDLRIDVPASSQVHQQLVKKEFEVRDVKVNPVTRLYFVEVPEPRFPRPRGEAQNLMQALAGEWHLHDLRLDPRLLPSLQPILHDGGRQVTVAVRYGKDIVALWPGLNEEIYGLAIDVGSTSIAVYLCNLRSGELIASAGAMNPQIRYGEDLMSRVSWAMQNAGGTGQLTTVVRAALDELISEICDSAGVASGQLLEFTLVGNPVMHHLVLGIDPSPLGKAPFTLATDHSVEVRAEALGLTSNPGASVYFLPCIAGHVGADTAAVMLAEAPWYQDEMTLIVDIGTNAEIVLGNRQRVLAASSPTGPAFEGAQISCGQRAAPGAIEHVRIDTTTLEPKFSVVGSKFWSDEPGFPGEIKESGVTGICGSGIVEAIAGLYLAGVIRADGLVDGSSVARSQRVRRQGRTYSYRLLEGGPGNPDIVITQADVRAIQLAKAALCAGARVLMQHMGVNRVDRIRLAGTFGSHIDVRFAMILGMIPDCTPAKVTSAGNAAGTGARLALLSQNARSEIEKRARSVERIELATDPDFQTAFVKAMGFPAINLDVSSGQM